MDEETMLLIEVRELVQSTLVHVSHGGPKREDYERWLYKANNFLANLNRERVQQAERT